MARRELKNYLRTYRKRSGLAQGDVSYLVKARTKGEWSRYEPAMRQPSLRTAFACEEALGVPVTRLFAGLRKSVGDETVERMQRLESRLKTTGNAINPRPPIGAETAMGGTTARQSAYPSHFSRMKKYKSLSRILALDLHPGRFGYVVLEDSTELLDWGVRRNYRGPKPWRTVLIQKRLSSLLDQWEPSLVLMNEAAKCSPQIRRLVTVIRNEARRRRLIVKLIGRAAVSGTFGEGR